MGLKGFWSERARAGQEDARLLLAARLHELRHRTFRELADLAGRTVVEDVAGASGDRFRRRTTIRRQTRAGEDELRILVAIDRGTRMGRLSPLAEAMVTVGRDREMTGEDTPAFEGDDPRRYRRS